MAPRPQGGWGHKDGLAFAGIRLDCIDCKDVRVTYLKADVFCTRSGRTTYAYDEMYALTSTSGAEATSFTYTTNGELETKTRAGETWS